jgi:hypothetical protein
MRDLRSCIVLRQRLTMTQALEAHTRRPPAIMIVPFAGACSGALSKATCESATTIAGTTTKAMQISFEEIPASRPAEVTSNCTTYLEPERRGWPAAGGLGATGVAQQKKANVRGSTTGCSHRTRSPIVKRADQ